MLAASAAHAGDSGCAGHLDIDGNGIAAAHTDGALIVRHLFGFSGAALTGGAVAEDADPALDEATEIAAAITCRGLLLDADGSGELDALGDGMLILRRLLGIGGDALVSHALSAAATRDAAGIAAYVDSLLPAAVGLAVRPSFTGSAIPTGAPPPVGGIGVERAYPLLTFTTPLFLAGVPGENRNVVVEQRGRVRAFANDAAASSAPVILDITSRVTFGGELGLLGLAFDPGFVDNRAFYVHYTTGSSGAGTLRSVIARFTWDAATDTAASASEHVLLEVAQPFTNHNAGMLAFGPDRRLYIAFGDGGSGFDPQDNAQDQGVLLGKLLRVAPPPAATTAPYAVPADNPFVGMAGVRPEIWASGLRNPFRFSFDRETGRLWLADVGQGMREEIDIVQRGGNYGWRIFEGTIRTPGIADEPVPSVTYSPPVFEYGRDQGNVVIGGYVYRGREAASLYGAYVYGDGGSGRIWALRHDGSTVLSNTQVGSVGGLYSFGEDAAGELRAVSGAGGIFRFTQSAGGGSAPPALLSQAGIFGDLATLEAAPGFIAYELNHAFWSDGALKRRWLAVPDGLRVGYDAEASFALPVGTVLVKHFDIELVEGDPASRRRLETRVLAHRVDGWFGLVYRWRDDGSDADLLPDRATTTLTLATPGGDATVDYEFPSRGDCLRCHNPAAGSALGLEARQVNRAFAYPSGSANQLRTWRHIGLFDGDVPEPSAAGVLPARDDPGATVGDRARTYLDVNCSPCHRPGGGTPVDMDLRRETPLAAMNVLDVVPVDGLGITGARRIAAGDAARSVLLARMLRSDGLRMPPVSSHRPDAAGSELVAAWITSLAP